MFDEAVVFVDIETTGGSYRTSRIIEFAAIRVESGKIVRTYHSLINPGGPIPYHITNITGLRTVDVEGAPYFNEIAEEIYSILDGAILIAHNVRFDYSFLKKQLELCNIPYSPRMLCSVRLSRALYPEELRHSLEAVINRHNIPVAQRHRAYEDAEVIMKFLNIAVLEHGQEEFYEAVKRQLKHKSAPPNVPAGSFDHIPNTPGVYIFSDQSDTPIYIGKSITLRKRIMSHFAQDTAFDKEMKLSLHTHKISYVETDNELEALLLESNMVKEKLPLYNRKLRRLSKMYIINAVQNESGYNTALISLINSEDLQPSKQVLGVYSSRMKAKKALDELQKTFKLCPKLLGLENTNKACFKSQLRKCLGACIQAEPHDSYNTRFDIAFERSKLADWPYKQPVILTHPSSATSKQLVIDNWHVIGEINQDEGCDVQYKPWQTGFDFDAYKIIRSYITGKSHIIKILPISKDQLTAYC